MFFYLARARTGEETDKILLPFVALFSGGDIICQRMPYKFRAQSGIFEMNLLKGEGAEHEIQITCKLW